MSNLSISTVSRMLSNKIRNPKTCSKVIAAIKSIHKKNGENYFSLKKRKSSKKIGLIGWWPTIESKAVAFNEIIQGINIATSAGGHFVFQMVSDGKYQKGSVIEQAIDSKTIDGAIFLGLDDSDENIGLFLKRKIPFILINRHPKDNGIGYVSVDNRRGGQLAVEYLVERGCSKFLAITTNANNSCFNERIKGFKNASKLSGCFLDVSSPIEKLGDKGWQTHINTLVKKNKIDVIVTTSDSIAAAAISALTNEGVHVPEDVSIMGFDNSMICEYTNPKLSSIASHLKDMGRIAIESLCLHIENKNIDVSKVLFRPEVVVRKSTR
ncbi:LacI family transcriptional regulator [bacterium]|nr:LacI family transcriptional regulator [bacterium]